jgi:hypothetical protein
MWRTPDRATLSSLLAVGYMKDDEGSRALTAAELVAAVGMAGAVGSLRRRWEFYPSCSNHFLQSRSLYLTMRWLA